MKIYTKTGDGGDTGLFAGPRVAKDDPRIEAYGAVDELNAVLGWVRCESPPEAIDALLSSIQHQLFVVGAELATPKPDQLGMTLIGYPQILELEHAIDLFEATLTPLRQFILPGGTRAASALHVARTVCRRAERRVVGMRRSTPVSDRIVVFLNRLSDLLFVLARAANSLAGTQDVPWEKLNS